MREVFHYRKNGVSFTEVICYDAVKQKTLKVWYTTYLDEVTYLRTYTND
jgi:hypothetical protein